MSSVRAGALADGKVRPGDVIEEINGLPTDGISHQELVRMILRRTKLTMLIVRRENEDSPKGNALQAAGSSDDGRSDNDGHTPRKTNGDERSAAAGSSHTAPSSDSDDDGNSSDSSDSSSGALPGVPSQVCETRAGSNQPRRHPTSPTHATLNARTDAPQQYQWRHRRVAQE